MRATDDLVVVVPGITGSVLQAEDGSSLWGTIGDIKRLLRTGGRELIVHDGSAGGVRATALLSAPVRFPSFLGMDTYRPLCSFLTGQLELDPRQVLEFAYDWRLSNRVSAEQLKREAEAALGDWAHELGPTSFPKLVLIGHSMGGLVARYYLEALDGWRKTRHLITMGTPFQGAPMALQSLLSGKRRLAPLMPEIDLSDAMRSLQSLYELLPTYAFLLYGSEEPRGITEIAFGGVDPIFLQNAVDFHAQINAVTKDRRVDPRVHAIVGMGQRTLTSLVPSGEPRTWHDGDGTVPARAATPIEWGAQPPAIYIPKRHARMQSEQESWNQIEGVLRQKQFQRLGARIGLSLRAPEFVAPNQPFAVEVHAGAANDGLVLSAWVRNTDDEIVAQRRLGNRGSGTYSTTLPALDEGGYRVEVGSSGASSVDSVSDVVIVCDPAEGLA